MYIDTKQHNNIVIFTINRPDRRNAVNLTIARELFNAFTEFEQDKSAHIAILTGAGGHFCAGADLHDLTGQEERVKETGSFAPMGPTRMRLSKPVIAAIEGYAVAGGLELALWCDLRVVSESTVFGVFCRRFGVPLIDLGTIRLPRLIGHSRAMDLILTGRSVSAHEAFDIGLANRLVKAGEALDKALELASQIAEFPSKCMQNDRLSALSQWDMSEEDAIKSEIRYGLDTIESGETNKGAVQFQKGKGRHGSLS